MTVVVGVVREDTVILISDSRATSLNVDSGNSISSDNLQKIIGLGKGFIVGYAGDVASVNQVLTDLVAHINVNPSPASVLSKVTELSGNKYFMSMQPFTLLLAVMEAKVWKLYCFSLENNFIAELVSSTKVIGSGSVVGDAVERFHLVNSGAEQSDKEYADTLIRTLSSLLARGDVRFVGGLPQALVLGENGVRTVHTGYVQMAPEELPDSKQIFFENGHWVQRDNSAGSELMIIGPGEMLNENASANVFHNYEVNTTPPGDMMWYVNAFIPCKSAHISPDSIVINGGMTSLTIGGYPKTVKYQLYLSLFGPSTGHHMVISLLNPSGISQTIYEGDFDNDNFPMEYEQVVELEMIINGPGEHFIECAIDGKCRVSRLINVHDFDESLSEQENLRVGAREDSRYIDGRPEASIPQLALFSLSNDEPITYGESTIINKQFSAVYIKNYPLEFNSFIHMLVQGNPGRHKFKIRLFDASTHISSYEYEGDVTLSSMLLKKPMLIRITLKFPKPGYYFLCIYFNDVMKGATVVIADTAPPSLGYSLVDADVESLLNDNIYHVLAKRPVKSDK